MKEHRHKHIGIGKIKEWHKENEHKENIKTTMNETRDKINKKGSKMVYYDYDED